MIKIKNSNGNTHQNLYISGGLVRRLAMAWIIIVKRPAIGIQKNAEVRPNKVTMMIVPLRMPAAEVCMPDLALIAEHEKELVVK